MTHTTNRKRRERIYPALIEGRMARGHRSLDGPEPWRPKLHGWRDIGYVTDDGGLLDMVDRDYAHFLQTRAQPSWSNATHDVLGNVKRAIAEFAESNGYTVTPEQERFLQHYYNRPRRDGQAILQLPLDTPLFIAPYGSGRPR